MKFHFSIFVQIIFFISIILITLFSLFFYEKREPKIIQVSKPSWENVYLKSVETVGPLRKGDFIPSGGPEDATMYPIKRIPKSKFYVYVHRMGLPIFCMLDGCSFFDGSIVECMGGWISGDEQPDPASSLGLNPEEVWKGNASVVIVADKNARIIGIYPQHTEGDVVRILATYPQYRDEVIRCMKKGVTLQDEEF